LRTFCFCSWFYLIITHYLFNMAQMIANGLVKEMLRPGIGMPVRQGDTVTVECTGYLHGGAKFWSTKDPGQQPFSFRAATGSVIRGWDLGVLTMTKGEGSRFTLAPDMGYGPGGFPAWGIPPNATLVFDIEVLRINGA